MIEGSQHSSANVDGNSPAENFAAHQNLQPCDAITNGTQQEDPDANSETDSAPAEAEETDVTGSGSAESEEMNVTSSDPAQAEEPENLENDSAFSENDDLSSSYSVTSAIRSIRHEDGLVYHSHPSAAYHLPINIESVSCLLHRLWVKKIGLYRAPLYGVDLHNCMDVGTGNGEWAEDFADEFPNTAVLAVDLHTQLPTWVPPNLEFQVGNLEEQWTFKRSFDYIHGRELGVCFNDFPKFLRQAFNSLRPGGYLELQDFKYPFNTCEGSNPAISLRKLQSDALRGAMEGFGQDWGKSHEYKELIEAAGFVEIQSEETQWPIGAWPESEDEKSDGRLFRLIVLERLRWFSQDPLRKGLGEDPLEAELSLIHAKDEVGHYLGLGIESFADIIVIYGRKPQ